MHKNDKRADENDGVVYELRTLPNRWEEPMGEEVLSSHASAKAALDASAHEPQQASDDTGRTTHGSYVANIVVRVDANGNESVTVPRPLTAESRTDASGEGRW